MAEREDESEQSPMFLPALGQRLRNDEGADTALTAILEEHILVDTAASDAVAKAKAAIIALATARATPVEPVAPDKGMADG